MLHVQSCCLFLKMCPRPCVRSFAAPCPWLLLSPCRSLQLKRKKNADVVKDGGCGKAEAPGDKGKKR
jgi:hypothetical protein